MMFIMLIFGLLALVRGEGKITSTRYISRTKARALGVLMLLGGVVLPLLVRNDASEYIAMATALLTFGIGLAVADKFEAR